VHACIDDDIGYFTHPSLRESQIILIPGTYRIPKAKNRSCHHAKTTANSKSTWKFASPNCCTLSVHAIDLQKIRRKNANLERNEQFSDAFQSDAGKDHVARAKPGASFTVSLCFVANISVPSRFKVRRNFSTACCLYESCRGYLRAVGVS